MGTIPFGHGTAKNAELATLSSLVRQFLRPRKNIRTIPTIVGHVTFCTTVTTRTLLPFEGLGWFVIVFGTLWHGQCCLRVGGWAALQALEKKVKKSIVDKGFWNLG